MNEDIKRIADALETIANVLEKTQNRDMIMVRQFEESFDVPEAQEACIGDRIKQRMDELNMSQRELAKACNVTEVSMSRYIRNMRVPKATLIMTIAKALDCQVEWLLGV